MKNWGPVIVVVALAILLAALFGPGVYRGVQLRRSIAAMLDAARAGRTADVVAAVEPDQQQEVAQLLAQYLPADYPQKIHSLKLSSLHTDDDFKAISIVTCRIEQGDYMGIYQGQLIWHYRDGHWVWDFLGSAGAEFSPAGEPDWVRLGDLIPLAESL